MEGTLQKVFAILIAVVIFFILPVYIAYEKQDDISYALALKITTDFVDSVNAKGYITSDMYDEFVQKLSITNNSYDIYMEHISKKYNPVIYSYDDDLKTIRHKFDYNLYKDQYESGSIQIDDGPNAGNYSNLFIAYDLAERRYTQTQILDIISSTDRTLTTDTSLDAYKSMNLKDMSSISTIYMPSNTTKVYTLNQGDEFNVIIKNKNTTPATIIYGIVTLGLSKVNNTKIYVNYGGTVKAETYREKINDEDTNNYNPENDSSETSSLVNSYITSGLVLLFNGEYNDATIHSNSTDVWKDISGNGNNAYLSNFDFDDESGWRYNGLHFTGKEYVALPEMNYSDMTIEIVMKLDRIEDVDTPVQSLVSCINEGGMGLAFNQLNSEEVSKKGKFSFDIFTKDELDNLIEQSSSIVGNNVVQSNKIYSVSGSVGKISLETDASGFAYDTYAQLLFVNGSGEGIPFNNTYALPAAGTTYVIGGTPLAGAGAITQFKGTVYCVRVYNRALTEEEIKENYKIDKQKYNITE